MPELRPTSTSAAGQTFGAESSRSLWQVRMAGSGPYPDDPLLGAKDRIAHFGRPEYLWNFPKAADGLCGALF